MESDEFYSMCRGVSKDHLLLEKINNAFNNHPSSMSDVVRNLSYDKELSVEPKVSGSIEVSSCNGSCVLYYIDGICYIIPKGNTPGGFIKVVFDTHEDGDCIEYGREKIWGAFEWDIDVATDEEIKDLLEVK